jgi:transposase
MTDVTSYSETIRARMIRRMVGPGAVSAHALARETGISHGALSKWLREAGKFGGMSDKDDPPNEGSRPPAPSASRRVWMAEDKLRVVIETSELEGAALGEYLRRGGLHQAEIEQWRADAIAGLGPGKAGPPGSSAERKRIKELERELRHKEKALAETAALLVLRKKLNALWGDGDVDTDEKNEP